MSPAADGQSSVGVLIVFGAMIPLGLALMYASEALAEWTVARKERRFNPLFGRKGFVRSYYVFVGATMIALAIYALARFT